MATTQPAPEKPNKPKTAGVSQTTPTDIKERRVVTVKILQPVIVFYIGGAGDKDEFYGTGPYGNVLEIKDKCDESFKALYNHKLYFSEYLGYNEACGEDDVKANVIDKIPNLHTPVYIIGHSLGGWNSAHLSAILSDKGYTVGMLITLDPVGSGLVQLVSNIYLSTPVPKAKFWINIRAEAKDTDVSDVIANAGGQWTVKKGANLNYIAPIHHANAYKMFVIALGKNSARDHFYASIISHTSSS